MVDEIDPAEHLLRLRLTAGPLALLQHHDCHRVDQDEPAGEPRVGPKHERRRHAQDHQVRVQRAEDVHRTFHQQKRRRQQVQNSIKITVLP